MTERDTDRLIIFDTSLRDGEQSPGFSMNLEEKLQVAQALARLRVDVIEAGFPAASPGDHRAVCLVSKEVKGPTIAGLARCHDRDIDMAWEALREADRARIHVFLATSAIHREHKLKLAKSEILRLTIQGVERARSYCPDVEFSPEDASRTEPEFLKEVVEAAIGAGATTINIPDTVGYAVPEEYFDLIRYLVQETRGAENAVFSTHCHNDLGLAVANSLAAVRGGARQVECTINGIGERAGNASMEEVVMAIHTRKAFFGLETGIDTSKLGPTSRLLCSITGVPVQPNKAIVGRNAFAHEAGIHQHGMIQNSTTYEIMKPEDVGFAGLRMVLGKHSGRHALRQKIEDLGYQLDNRELDVVFAEFKKLADRKKDIEDADLSALVVASVMREKGPWEITALQTNAGTATMAMASVRMVHKDGTSREEAAVGDGPIDATFKAIARATGCVEPILQNYEVHNVTFGQDAQGQVTVVCEHNGRQIRGQGVSTDIIEASAKAFVDVVNQVESLITSTPPTTSPQPSSWQSNPPATSGTTAS